MSSESMLPLDLPCIPPFAIGRQFGTTRKGNDGDAVLIDFHLKHFERKASNGFSARLRGIHQNNSHSVPG